MGIAAQVSGVLLVLRCKKVARLSWRKRVSQEDAEKSGMYLYIRRFSCQRSIQRFLTDNATILYGISCLYYIVTIIIISVAF